MFKLTQASAVCLVADERLYLTADRNRVVKEGDPTAAFLLAAKGQVIPPHEAKRLGLSAPKPTEEVSGTEPERRRTRPAKSDFQR